MAGIGEGTAFAACAIAADLDDGRTGQSGASVGSLGAGGGNNDLRVCVSRGRRLANADAVGDICLRRDVDDDFFFQNRIHGVRPFKIGKRVRNDPLATPTDGVLSTRYGLDMKPNSM